jgi:adenosylcobyric acid synthase
LLFRNGVSAAPFKAQNMSLNSWVTDDGSEIGQAQGIQAFAAGVTAEAIMNPVLLKPAEGRRAQVVVLGKPWVNLDAGSYGDLTADLRPIVRDSLAELRSRFDVVVCEGAGSAAEINLLEHDIANLPLALDCGLPAVVVGDIDRGGVMAALYGTVRILPDELAQTIQGFIVNKFRGDPTSLEPGLVELEKLTGVRTIGVIPWIERAELDAEDSVGPIKGSRGPRCRRCRRCRRWPKTDRAAPM